MKWNIAPKIPQDIDDQLAEYPRLVRQLVYGRGYTSVPDARQFLEAASPDDEPMLGIDAACVAIQATIRSKKPIIVYGDYDVDGVTACALLVPVLKSMGADARCFIPNRFEHGYGLNVSAVDYFATLHVGLIITADCGIRSLEAAQRAHEHGIHLIITDHHIPGPELPNAIAIIDPKQPGDPSKYKELAGVGVAYKLACALADVTHNSSVLDLVALGTVADVAPLVGENRYLVRAGLHQIANHPSVGITALAKEASTDLRTIKASDIGYRLGPRLNAAGRLDTALTSYELLTTSDEKAAAKIAKELDEINTERQKATRTALDVADGQVAKKPGEPVLFASHPDFNVGVVGLVASRLCERYYRPAIVGTTGEETTRASCRSIPEVHITNALEKCADLLETFGGHAAAAGFTIRNENIPAFLSAVRDAVGDLTDLKPTLDIDMEIGLDELSPLLPELLEWIEPTGQDNRRPLFLTRNMQVLAASVVGKGGEHLKMMLTDGEDDYDAIGYDLGCLLEAVESNDEVDVVYTCITNEFRGQIYVQLVVRDIRPSEGG